MRGHRIRLRLTSWPRHGLELTDTPRPRCTECHGQGGWNEDYADADGDYGGTNWVICGCWKLEHHLFLLPLPRRRPRGPFSDEPPF
ncbi:hypothetical protein ACQ86D_27950 [Streptomyces galilaeus]